MAIDWELALCFLAGACHAVGGFLKEGVGSKGNNTGTSVIPIFFHF